MSGLFTVLRFIGNACYWIPLGFPLSMLAWSYYAYVIIFCGTCLTDGVLQVVLSVVYHLLLVLCLWSYAMTTFTPSTPVPQRFKLGEVEKGDLSSCARNPKQRHALLKDMANRRGVRTRRFDGAVNYCEPCQLVKPDRCHHCSQCERCVTKMDHHCPWFNNCVSFTTYKFFLLTLFYLALLGAYVSSSVSIYMWHLHPQRSLARWSVHLRFLLIVGALTCLSFGSFFYMHLCFVACNRTSLEAMRPPVFLEKGDSFDLGTRRNFLEVFGPDKALWAFPVATSLGDGSLFPTRLHPNRDSLLGIATALPHPRPTGSIATTANPEVAVHAVSAAGLEKGNLAPVSGTSGGGAASSAVLKTAAGAMPEQCPAHGRLPASVHRNDLPQAKLAYIPTRAHTGQVAADLSAGSPCLNHPQLFGHRTF